MDAIGRAARAIFEQFIYATTPPHLKKLVNQAHLENSTYKEIVTHVDRNLKVNDLEAPGGLQVNTMSQYASKLKSLKVKPTCHHCENPGHYQNQCRQQIRQRIKN